MSHIYQPVMLEVLLTHRGAASVREIAAAILAHDESQLDYYEEIVKSVKAASDPDTWNRASAEGRAMTLDEAAEYALSSA